MAIATPFPASVSVGSTRPPAARPEPVRLTRRGKAVLTLGVSILGFAVLQGTGALEAVAVGTGAGPATAMVVAGPGDTLWSIAERVAPGADPRATILMIEELNGLEPGVGVRVGQGLVVPR